MLAFNPVWLFKVKEEIHESYEAEAELVLNYFAFGLIARIIAGEPAHVRIARTNIMGVKYILPVGFAGGYGIKRFLLLQFVFFASFVVKLFYIF